MQILSPTFRDSLYDIIHALQNQGTENQVFLHAQDSEKAGIYGGTSCIEISPLVNIIANPLQLFPIIPGRGNYFTMQLAELIWILAGKTNISEFFGQFASPAVKKFSHNTDDLYAAYGYRIRNYPEGNDVLHYVIATLNEKITSRSAIIPLFNAALDTVNSEHKPCATTFQLYVYEGKLDGILTLRANDVIKGYSAINFLEFAFIQAIVAYCIKYEVGRFINFTTTMHYYTGDAAQRIEQIKHYRQIDAPSADIVLSDLFNESIPFRARYESILEDVQTIYTTLQTNQENVEHSIVSFNHPIFHHIFTILQGIQQQTSLHRIIETLPTYLIFPLLESSYRNTPDEVCTILAERSDLNKYRKAIMWRTEKHI